MPKPSARSATSRKAEDARWLGTPGALIMAGLLVSMLCQAPSFSADDLPQALFVGIFACLLSAGFLGAFGAAVWGFLALRAERLQKPDGERVRDRVPPSRRES